MQISRLFDDPDQASKPTAFAEDAILLRGYALPRVHELLAGFHHVGSAAPLRHMHTPGGRRMAVANTNAGARGWISDQHGYRYSERDPASGQPWPAMPTCWHALARSAATLAGFPDFDPDACLVNLYVPGTRLSLHQDRDEADFTAPIVSISLGLPATFLFGGHTRQAPCQRISLLHGDVLVWGGASRLAFHGVAALAEGQYPLLGRQRINLTLRRAG